MFKLHGKSKKYFQKTLKVAGNCQKMNLGNPVIEVFGTSGEQPGLSNQLIKKVLHISAHCYYRFLTDLALSYADEMAYLILSREFCLCSMSFLRGECALHNF